MTLSNVGSWIHDLEIPKQFEVWIDGLWAKEHLDEILKKVPMEKWDTINVTLPNLKNTPMTAADAYQLAELTQTKAYEALRGGLLSRITDEKFWECFDPTT